MWRHRLRRELVVLFGPDPPWLWGARSVLLALIGWRVWAAAAPARGRVLRGWALLYAVLAVAAHVVARVKTHGWRRNWGWVWPYAAYMRAYDARHPAPPPAGG